MKTRTIFSIVALLLISSCQSSGVNGSKVKTSAKAAQNQENKLVESVPSKDGSLQTNKQLDPNITASVKSNETGANIIANYSAPKTGVVYTWQNNWANLPETISYKVSGKVKKGSSEYLKLTSTKGFKNTTHAFYKTTDFSLKGYRDSKDKALVTFKPTEQRYKFPMGPGSQWVTSWKQLDHKSGKITNGGGIVKAIRWETLNLPAGKIRALKVKLPVQKGLPRGISHFVWFSPEHGITVQEEIGGGSFNWSQRLSKIEKPTS